jgi:hypothetical protein
LPACYDFADGAAVFFVLARSMVNALKFQASTKHFFRLVGAGYVDGAKRTTIILAFEA